MTYSVKEIFYTLQGEGINAGRPAVFCRFAGCNLWSGREKDRAKAVCTFCDTDFVGTDGTLGGKYRTPEALAQTIAKLWPEDTPINRLVVLTGGEPMMQVDKALADCLHAQGFTIAIETNGTMPVISAIDWICVSPKAGAPLVQTRGQELKLVYPQAGLDPAELNGLDFEHFLLQPMDNPARTDNTAAAIDYCMSHPQWRLSIQGHKYCGIR
jgi:7-carboxy-7-deazaguanine synthase (Cx14CxxC type)